MVFPSLLDAHAARRWATIPGLTSNLLLFAAIAAAVGYWSSEIALRIGIVPWLFHLLVFMTGGLMGLVMIGKVRADLRELPELMQQFGVTEQDFLESTRSNANEEAGATIGESRREQGTGPRPDYGLWLRKHGVSSAAAQQFYRIGIDHISIVGPSKYSTLVTVTHGSQEFAASLDFDQRVLRKLLTRIPQADSDRLALDLQADSTGNRTLELANPAFIGLTARLGNLQRGANEEFIPLVVEDVFESS